MQKFTKRPRKFIEVTFHQLRGCNPLVKEMSRIEAMNKAFNRHKSQKNIQNAQTTKDIA